MLICELHYASEVMTLKQVPSNDPYSARMQTIGERFGFRAAVLGSGSQIEHVTLSVYDLSSPDAPMVHQLRLAAPFKAGTDLPALTGWNHVYSTALGRELKYGCALRDVGQEGAAR